MAATENGSRRSSTYRRVDKDVFCVLTRVELRSPIWLVVMAWGYFRTRHLAHRIRSLKKTAFLLQGWRTVVILSIWDGEAGFVEFGMLGRGDTSSPHIHTVRAAWHSATRKNGKPSIWSTQWRIDSVGNNLNWDGIEPWHCLLGLPSGISHGAASQRNGSAMRSAAKGV